MDITDRQSRILEILRRDGRVEVERLAATFDVTTQTIRRDLNELCDRGLAARIHGGAKRAVSVSNVAYEQRRQLQIGAKEAIGAVAAQLIPDNCSVIMNIGTTTEQVAHALTARRDLVVLSNNVNIINIFLGVPVRELILVGGSVRQSDGAIVGEQAVEFIRRYKVDFAIIGASAMDEDGTILDYDSREVSVARAILANARVRILACDRSKFERTAPVRICALGDLDYVVTDGEPPPGFVDAARAAGTQIVTPDTAAEIPETEEFETHEQ